MNDLTEINNTLKKIESKIEDKSPFSIRGLIDFEKIQERSRKQREDERNEEMLKLQKIQSEMSTVQTNSIKNQEKLSEIIAFTGAIIALTTIYDFIIKSAHLERYTTNYWIITLVFLSLIVICTGPLVMIIINFWRRIIFEWNRK